MRPTPIDWLPYLSNIAPPDLRRKKSTSNLLSKIKANTKLPINTVLEIPPPTRLISRNPAWVADENVDLKEEWRNRWSNLAIANKDLVEDPNTKPPGYNLPRRTWSTLNRIRTSTGRCNYLLNKWNMSPDQNCDCGQIQTMHHILRDCPRRFFQGTLGDIHRCTEEALEWIQLTPNWCSGFVYQRPKDFKNALRKYNVIGFDMDHTICQYKLDPLNNLLYELHANFLIHQRNYDPQFLSLPFENGREFIQKGLILDKARGNILKISYHHKILRAYHGTKPLTLMEIMSIYGSDLVYRELEEFPQCHVLDKSSKHEYYIFFDYFVTFASLICARLVDSIDAKNGLQPIYYFWNDVYDGLIYIFSPSGGFFERISQCPGCYIKKCSSHFKAWLQHLHSNRKIFLLSNSGSTYVSFLCSFCLGPDWQQCFDIVITNGGKPNFFKSSSNFFKVEHGKAMEVVSREELSPHRIYACGNWNDLNYFFTMSSAQEPHQTRILYFGDSFIHDVYTPAIYSCCDTAAIVEELQMEESHHVDRISKAWGSFFQDYVHSPGERVTTLCYNTICKYATFILPAFNKVVGKISSTRHHHLGFENSQQSFDK
ncbi:NT5DC1 [Cordylochernes scorpioides]|uniref:NT5DC1 n=1 Tax=Cordylochernes scorpioides TaxID=51811 RepID=A0ABY6LJY5_9ARAC|nr:NT5DC1 [Cordylochernes scorpioides]